MPMRKSPPLGCVLVLAASLAGACGGAQTAPASPMAQDVASIQARLTAGPWRLVEYRPEVQLEPMLQLLLAQQIRTMMVRFDGRVLSLESPTVHVTRPYTLQNAAGLVCDLVSPDLQGGGELRTRLEVTLDGSRVTFRAQTDPWRGTGVIVREAP
jgi:hypothetical protein